MHAHRVTDNFTALDPKLPGFPTLLRGSGYRTGFFGKWHMGGDSDEPQPGFHEWLSFRGQGEYADPQINRNGVREKRKGYTTEVLTNEAKPEAVVERFLSFVTSAASSSGAAG
jgi:N-acetylglucosamine-6-sulfatase